MDQKDKGKKAQNLANHHQRIFEQFLPQLREIHSSYSLIIRAIQDEFSPMTRYLKVFFFQGFLNWTLFEFLGSVMIPRTHPWAPAGDRAERTGDRRERTGGRERTGSERRRTGGAAGIRIR